MSNNLTQSIRDTNSFIPRRIKSFVRRARSFSSTQQEQYLALWVKYGLVVCAQSWQKLFPDEINVGLDIGFGMGESLAHWANTLKSNERVIGVEVHRPGLLHAMQLLEAQQIYAEQVKLIEGDVLDILNWIPEASCSRIQILFPDPWPKQRHHKRRLIREDTLPLFVSKLKTGGIFYFVSDWQHYAQSVFQLCSANTELEFCQNDESEKLLAPALQTRFACKGIKQGHEITCLKFVKR